jgi:hypothetical protein
MAAVPVDREATLDQFTHNIEDVSISIETWALRESVNDVPEDSGDLRWHLSRALDLDVGSLATSTTF